MYWFSFTSLSTTLIQASVTYNSPLIGLTPSTIVLLFYSQYSQSDLLKIQISAHSHLCIKIKCKVISIASRPCMIYLCLPLRHLMSLLPLLTTMLTPAFSLRNALNLFPSQVLHTCSFLKSKSSFYTLPDELLVILGLSLTCTSAEKLLERENQVPCYSLSLSFPIWLKQFINVHVIFKPNGSLTFWAARSMSETASILFTAISLTLSPV